MGGFAFSVVVPVFNGADFLGQALDSVLGQEVDLPFEIIVVNDGSTDRTEDVVRSRPAVDYIAKPNGGPGSARNLGVGAAASDLILFLDGDDIALPGRFARQCRFMLDNPDVALSFGNWRVEEASADYLAGFGLNAPFDMFEAVHDPLEQLMTVGCFIPTSTVAIRRDAYILAGGQPEDRYYAEDYALWCRVAANGARFAVTGAPLAWYRTRSSGRLTRSRHTHAGLTRTLHEALSEYGVLLTEPGRALAHGRYQAVVDAFLRHEWAYNGRSEVLRRIAELGPLLPERTRRKWQFLSLVPSALPRVGRHLIRGAYASKRARLKPPSRGTQHLT